jgi:hypothetical protein
MTRDYRVTVKVVTEHFATVTVRAHNQAAADDKAIAWYYRDAHTDEGPNAGHLGLPSPRWYEDVMPREHEPVIDRTFRCVDCGKDTQGGEYYMVADELWAAAGMAPNGGMLCLADLERRIGRPLVPDDFTAMFARDWHRHVAAREAGGRPGEAADAAWCNWICSKRCAASDERGMAALRRRRARRRSRPRSG